MSTCKNGEIFLQNIHNQWKSFFVMYSDLCYFSILPATGISVKILLKIFDIPKQENVQFYNTLKQLSQKGWLIQESTTFRCHSLVQEVVKFKYYPDLVNCRDLVKGITKAIYYETGMPEGQTAKWQYVDYAQSLWDTFSHKDEDVLKLGLELGARYRHMARYEKGHKITLKVLEIREQYYYEDKKELARTYKKVAFGLASIGNSYKESLKYRIKALELAQSYDKTNLGEYYDNVGFVLRRLGSLNEATNYFERAIALKLEEIKYAKTPDELVKANLSLSSTYNNYSFVFRQKKDYDLAEKYLQKSYELKQEYSQDESLRIAIYHSNIGVIYRKQEKYDLAKLHLESALNIKKDILSSEDHPKLRISYIKLAELYADTYELEKSLILIKKAIYLYEKCLGADNKEVLDCYVTYGEVILKMNPELDQLEHIIDKIRYLKSVNDISDGMEIYSRMNKVIHDLQNAISVRTGESNEV